jgi:hypothetical protein
MAMSVIPGIRVEYGGLYADESIVDLQELGISLQGLSKVSNSIINFYLSGDMAHDSRLYRVRVFGGPPKAGSLLYELVALLVTGEFPLYARALVDLAGHFIPQLTHAVVAKGDRSSS